jgi:hypothetical protein
MRVWFSADKKQNKNVWLFISLSYIIILVVMVEEQKLSLYQTHIECININVGIEN